MMNEVDNTGGDKIEFETTCPEGYVFFQFTYLKYVCLFVYYVYIQVYMYFYVYVYVNKTVFVYIYMYLYTLYDL
jgi:hypothetical protein